MDLQIFDTDTELMRPATQEDINLLCKIAECYGALTEALRLSLGPTPDIDERLEKMCRLRRAARNDLLIPRGQGAGRTLVTSDELERAAKALRPHPLGDQNKLIALCDGLAVLLQHLADCERQRLDLAKRWGS